MAKKLMGEKEWSNFIYTLCGRLVTSAVANDRDPIFCDYNFVWSVICIQGHAMSHPWLKYNYFLMLRNYRMMKKRFTPTPGLYKFTEEKMMPKIWLKNMDLFMVDRYWPIKQLITFLFKYLKKVSVHVELFKQASSFWGTSSVITKITS